MTRIHTFLATMIHSLDHFLFFPLYIQPAKALTSRIMLCAVDVLCMSRKASRADVAMALRHMIPRLVKQMSHTM